MVAILKFHVFRNGKAAEEFTVSGAYMFGVDSVPLRKPVKVSFKNGCINCERKGTESVGLSLLWPVEGCGHLLLSTTRLPERKNPYILNVELARAKLMEIIVKREEWGVFGASDKSMELVRQSERFFVDSLKNISNPEKASVLADKSLKKGILYAERLAGRHSELILGARCKNNSLNRHSLGCCIDPDLMVSEQYRKRVFEMFGSVMIPMSWAKLEPERGEYDFDSIDRCIEGLAGRRLAVCAGPLLVFNKENLPKWILKGKANFEKIRESCYEFVHEVVARYSDHIHAWRVISGVNVHNIFGFNYEQVVEITRTATLAAKSSNGKSRKIIEILMPWGEYYTDGNDAIAPLMYADMVLQSGISFDAFGLEMHFGKDADGMRVRDMMQISSKLDSLGAMGKPLQITGVAIPDKPSGEEERAGGVWHKPWNAAVQAEWIEQFYKIALGKLFVASITYSVLADSGSEELAGSGLLNSELGAKKAFLSIAKLQKVILKKK